MLVMAMVLGAKLGPEKSVQPMAQWYVHVASAFPLAHRYRAVLA